MIKQFVFQQLYPPVEKSFFQENSIPYFTEPVLYSQSAAHVIRCLLIKCCREHQPGSELCSQPVSHQLLSRTAQHFAFQASEMRILNPNCLLKLSLLRVCLLFSSLIKHVGRVHYCPDIAWRKTQHYISWLYLFAKQTVFFCLFWKHF